MKAYKTITIQRKKIQGNWNPESYKIKQKIIDSKICEREKKSGNVTVHKDP